LGSCPESPCSFQCTEAFSMFPSSSFIVSGLAFKCSIHFELTVVTDEIWGFSFILLHVTPSFLRATDYKCMFLNLCHRQLAIDLWAHVCF
jgi:hypothetical protein